MRELLLCKFPSINCINLSQNSLKEGVRELRKMEWYYLDRLDISNNDIGEECIEDLSRMNAPYLKFINLRQNGIERRGLESLEQAYPNAIIKI
jgi:Ran GTPase-activating protein (RanGAP) involved in mRNA processing and transport